MNADFCHVADGECVAPSGYRAGNGIADGDRKTRGECYACGRPVCGPCSRRRLYLGRRRRVCLDCLDMLARDRALADEALKGRQG